MYATIATKSNRNRYSVSVAKIGGGKFCKICKDVGKTLDEYTNHYVRETDNVSSRVVCPTLKATVCRYCNKSGHTVNHCPKTNTSKQQQRRVKEPYIGYKNYCLPVSVNITSKNNNLSGSSFLVLTDDDGPNDDGPNPVSYASVISKKTTPTISYTTVLPSNVESRIPVKPKLHRDNIITLDKVTKRWADDEDDLEDCDIIYMMNAIPPLFVTNNISLQRFVAFIDELAKNYTDNFSKSIAITRDAFQQLSKNWETNFFDSGGDRNAFDKSINTNAKARSLIMTERYIQQSK